MKYTAVSVRQLNRKGRPWQARAKYKDVFGKWKEVSKILPEAKGKRDAYPGVDGYFAGRCNAA